MIKNLGFPRHGCDSSHFIIQFIIEYPTLSDEESELLRTTFAKYYAQKPNIDASIIGIGV
jgi:hypothetical protein